ncbi:MAG TPA: hypothetical protein VMT16_11040, partial [Thermoanaerobaculia bacterium]|nr:hypothetical protein [Thermoanaerobaculia bacterium]
MAVASYHELKHVLLTYLPLSKDAFHIYIGMGCLLLSVLVLRLSPGSFKALLLGLAVSLIMEAFDWRDTQRYHDVTVRVVGSTKDLVNTNLIPLVVVLLVRWRGAPG